MKIRDVYRILLSGVMLALAVGCSSSPMSRIDSNRAEYESWPLDVQEAVLSGRADPGMTPRQVEVAMGKPSEVRQRPSRSGDEEVWVYREGGGALSKLGGVSIGVGTSVGGVGVGGSQTVGGQNRGYTPQREVVFRDGVVSGGSDG